MAAKWPPPAGVTDRNVTKSCDKMTAKTQHNRFVRLQKVSGPLPLIREEEEEEEEEPILY